MTETNGAVKRTHMSYVQFHQAVETLREHVDEFLTARPSDKDAAAMLGKLCGFNVPVSKVKDLQEAAPLTWEPKCKAKAVKGVAPEDLRVAVNCLARLYGKMGEEYPAELKVLWERLNGRSLAAEVHA